MKTRKPYRVFVTRHYIAVSFFDIAATSKQTARTAAVKAAYLLKPDPRQEATDNGWIADEGLVLTKLGYSSTPFKVKAYYETKAAKVYIEDETVY